MVAIKTKEERHYRKKRNNGDLLQFGAAVACAATAEEP
jgi:hypothetical protein